MTLLERDALLAQLQAQLDGAVSGAGRLVFVEGEAGIGKTALLRGFAQAQFRALPVLWGSCDALQTPRTLGALDDIAGQARGELRALLDGGAERHRLFVAFLDLLTTRPGLVVLEDLHWADGATLDLLRYVGRRMPRTRSLLVASLRNDQLVPAHPLRAVLGDLATSGALRLAPAPLSIDAVRTLCGERHVDAVELHRRTAGNPFFVTEVLAAAEHGLPGAVPDSVSDAVLARAARLSPSARAVLDAAAVAGPRTEPWLLQALTATDGTSIDECLATGVLRSEETLFSFRHELARQAVLRAMTPSHATRLHRLALQALTSLDAERSDAARLAHHATGAGDAQAVRRWAPAAAHEAGARGAHRQAAAHWAGAVEHAATNVERARWLDEYSAEAQMAGGLDEAVRARRDAARLWLGTGQPGSAAVSLSRLALLLVLAGRNAEAETSMHEARSLIGPNDNAPAAFQVRLVAAGMRMLDHDSVEAIALIVPVLAEAERMNDEAAIVRSLVTLGAALLGLDRVDEGVAALERALALAERLHNDQLIGMTFANLGSGCAEMLRLDLAERCLQRGIGFCAERDLDAQRLCQLSWLAAVRLHQGRWDDACAAAQEVIDDRRATPIARIMALIGLGRLRARRGEPGVWTVLDEARELAAGTATLQRMAPMHAARAEAAWLEGRNDVAAAEASAGLTLANAKRHARYAAELVLWCR